MYQGNLPIRALQNNFVHYFERSNFDFISELRDEANYNDLQRAITYDDQMVAIHTIAEITPDKRIVLYEPFMAFLWCLSYALVTFYKEQDTANPDPENNQILRRAINTVIYGASLFRDWSPWDLSLPNPEIYNLEIDPHIHLANGVMVMANSFIMAHEYSHSYLGHELDPSTTTSDQLLQEEFDADNNALDILLAGIGEYDQATDHSINWGIVVGICSLLFKDSQSWEGGSSYPDSDTRVFKLIDKLSDGDNHSENWKLGISILIIWEILYTGSSTDPMVSDSPKQDFSLMLANLKQFQRCC